MLMVCYRDQTFALKKLGEIISLMEVMGCCNLHPRVMGPCYPTLRFDEFLLGFGYKWFLSHVQVDQVAL